LRAFATFSYIPRDELFSSEVEALEFIRRNARAIVAGRM